MAAVRGEKEKALTLIEGIKEREVYLYGLTSIYSVLGMKDKAIENIRKGIDTGFRDRKEYLFTYQVLKNNHFYERLRDDSRLKEIVKSEKAKYDERLERYGQF